MSSANRKFPSVCRRARRLLKCVIALLVAVSVVPAVAQQAGPGARAASFERPAPAVRFARQPPEVGDQVEQTIAVDVRMTIAERHGMDVVGQTQSAARSSQRRVVTTSDVAGGVATGVKLRYVTATRQTGRGDGATEAELAPPEAQPTSGKVYTCHCAGDALLVTDARGDIPPLGEYELVAQHMELLGRPNPLADFLAGQTVRVGQRVSLPSEVAERLLGIGDRLGTVKRFDLTLTGTATEDGAACAVFQADVEAASSDSSQMCLQVGGPMVIQTDSCRPVRIELSGPIGMSETRGSYSTKYYLIGTGHMAVNLQSVYHDVRR